MCDVSDEYLTCFLFLGVCEVGLEVEVIEILDLKGLKQFYWEDIGDLIAVCGGGLSGSEVREHFEGGGSEWFFHFCENVGKNNGFGSGKGEELLHVLMDYFR